MENLSIEDREACQEILIAVVCNGSFKVETIHEHSLVAQMVLFGQLKITAYKYGRIDTVGRV